jgi:outer membrane protein, heavy metal efflux system
MTHHDVCPGRRYFVALASAALGLCRSSSADAQGTPTPISRTEAVEATVARGARLALARADTAVAFAQLLTARALQNPTLSATYSGAPPKYHLIADLPVDYPGVRRTRIQSAQLGRRAAQYRFAFERAAAALDADTTYTRALAALERARLSRRNARDADSLRGMVVARRDAGDASTLDVELATLTAGQAANVAAADSLTFLSTVLDLQTVIGLPTDRVAVVPADSLGPPPAMDGDGNAPAPAAPIRVAAATLALESAALAARLQRRSILGAPSISGGIETGDPGQRGILPTFGVSLPLPLLDRNRGPIAQAEAERERARAELTLAQLESQAQIGRARRERAIALAKVERDRRLVASANRVAAMSVTAYREGASSLPNVLEAQRNAREILAAYVDDLAAAWIATAVLRVVMLTSSSVGAK